MGRDAEIQVNHIMKLGWSIFIPIYSINYVFPDNIFDHSEKRCIYLISATHHFLRVISGKLLKDIEMRFFAKSLFILPFLAKTTEDWKKDWLNKSVLGFTKCHWNQKSNGPAGYKTQKHSVYWVQLVLGFIEKNIF